MLANIRRKLGIPPGIVGQPLAAPPPQFVENMVISPPFHDSSMPPPFTMEELGFVPPGDKNIVSPAAIPLWLQEQVCRRVLLRKSSCSTLPEFAEYNRYWLPAQWFRRHLP